MSAPTKLQRIAEIRRETGCGIREAIAAYFEERPEDRPAPKPPPPSAADVDRLLQSVRDALARVESVKGDRIRRRLARLLAFTLEELSEFEGDYPAMQAVIAKNSPRLRHAPTQTEPGT